MQKETIARLQQLEKRSGSMLPEVVAEYQNGDKIKYRGLPPMEHLFCEDNPIINTSGSDFAELVNALIHPLPNREFSDFEEACKEEKD